MVEIVYKNPYRIIGVYANSAVKERVGNLTRMKAYMKVGKTVDFPLDLPIFLSSICRTEELVARAESQITLPADQLKYAQFWFVKKTAFDEIAFNHLFNGGLDKALEIWTKKDDVSSLQNRIVCAMIKNDWQSVIQNAEKLYTNFSSDFANLILGDNHTIQVETLADTFLEELSNNVNVSSFVSYISNSEWKHRLGDKIVKPIIASIEKEINEAKAAKGSPEARYKAGKKLIEVAKIMLPQLKQHLQTSDMQYQVIADKLGIEILQCGIDYYNGADEGDECTKVEKAFLLQNFALSIVVGKLAKDRCKENVNILKEIQKELPPKEISYYDREIKKIIDSVREREHIRNGHLELLSTSLGYETNLILEAIDFIKRAMPYLMSIKEILGENNTYYLKISTLVVSIALQKVINGFNIEMVSLQKKRLDLLTMSTVRSVFKSAWEATLYMDRLDMESNFRSSRYTPNRNSLREQVQGEIDINRPISIDMRGETALFEGCNSISDCKKYIYTFPWGKYIAKVRLKLEKLEFSACKSVEDCEKFKDKYPNSTYNIDEKLEECCYKQCNNIKEYNRYVSKYPQGKYVLQAKEKIAELTEKNCFEQSSSIADYENYISKYPKGKYVQQAREILEEEKMWQDCLLQNSRKKYKEYLAKYPNGKYKQIAENNARLFRKKMPLKQEQIELKSQYKEQFSIVKFLQSETFFLIFSIIFCHSIWGIIYYCNEVCVWDGISPFWTGFLLGTIGWICPPINFLGLWFTLWIWSHFDNFK